MEGESFSNPTGISWQGHTGVVKYGEDQQQVVMFYNKAIHNPVKSAQAGRPQFEDKIFVKIHPPGERLNIIDREVKEEDTRRFPVQWNKYMQNKEQAPDGSPIQLLYPDYPSIAAMLRASSVQTVEQCASLSGHAIETIGMGTQRYVNDAKTWMAAANKGVPATAFRHELEQRDRTIKVLSKQVEELKQQLDKAIQLGLNRAMTEHQVSQELVAERPMHRPQTGFDASMAQLNANDPSNRRGATPAMPAAKAKPVRRRAALAE